MRKIAVIGGGITGMSVAWHLRSRGLGDVHVFERDKLGCGTTWHSAGDLTWYPGYDNDTQVLYILNELIPQLEKQTGLSSGWRETGRLYLARDGKAVEFCSNLNTVMRERGFDTRMLSPKEAVSHHPALNASAIQGALYNPLSGNLNPAGLLELFVRSSKALGVTIREQTKIRKLSTKAGRINGVVTAAGETLPFDDVVVCAGLWSPGLVDVLDIPVAQGGCEHFYLIMDFAKKMWTKTPPSFSSASNQIYGREDVGGILLGFFDSGANVIDVGALPEPFSFALLNENWDKIMPYFEGATELFPAFKDASVRTFINGPEAFTPDGRPIIGPAKKLSGLWLATGMNSYGITNSGSTGHIIADLMAGVPTRFPSDIYATDRFDENVRDARWLRKKVSDSVSTYFGFN